MFQLAQLSEDLCGDMENLRSFLKLLEKKPSTLFYTHWSGFNKQTFKAAKESLFQLYSSRCQLKDIPIMELGSIHLGSHFILA